MKQPLICALALCLATAAQGSEFGAFVKKVESAQPWKLEQVENAFGIKFTLSDSREAITSHYAEGSFVFGKGLVVKKIENRTKNSTQEALLLIVDIDDKKSACFSKDDVLDLFPDEILNNGISFRLPTAHGVKGETYYKIKKPWGEFSFGFGDKYWGFKSDGNCLTSIVVRTNALLKK